ncbi:MAG: YceD family protein [Candidatus Binatia bacterium]
MKLNVHEIEEAAKELAYDEPTAPLNDVLVHGAVRDYTFTAPAAVRVEYYRAGQELFFHGRITGNVVGQCARCVEAYTFRLEKEFSLVLVPRPDSAVQTELSEEDLDLSFYQGDAVDLSPLIQEQLLLALPTRPLCQDACKGLCPQCGINLNAQTCQCTIAVQDPRLAILRNLKVKH